MEGECACHSYRNLDCVWVPPADNLRRDVGNAGVTVKMCVQGVLV